MENGLTRAGLVRRDYGRNDTPAVFLRRNLGGRSDMVARIDAMYSAALKLAGARSVVIGWTACWVRLLEKNRPTSFQCSEQGHIAAAMDSMEGKHLDHLRKLTKEADASGTKMDGVEEGRPESSASADQTRNGVEISTDWP